MKANHNAAELASPPAELLVAPEYLFDAGSPRSCAFGRTCRMPPEQRCGAECRLTQVE